MHCDALKQSVVWLIFWTHITGLIVIMALEIESSHGFSPRTCTVHGAKMKHQTVEIEAFQKQWGMMRWEYVQVHYVQIGQYC